MYQKLFKFGNQLHTRKNVVQYKKDKFFILDFYLCIGSILDFIHTIISYYQCMCIL